MHSFIPVVKAASDIEAIEVDDSIDRPIKISATETSSAVKAMEADDSTNYLAKWRKKMVKKHHQRVLQLPSVVHSSYFMIFLSYIHPNNIVFSSRSQRASKSNLRPLSQPK